MALRVAVRQKSSLERLDIFNRNLGIAGRGTRGRGLNNAREAGPKRSVAPQKPSQPGPPLVRQAGTSIG